MKSTKMWSGRFSENPDALFESFSESLSFDRRLAPFDVQVNRAYAKALHRIGIFSDAEITLVLKHLDHIAIELEAGTFPFNRGDEDIHMALERRLTELAGVVGARIHTGRSRNDQVVTDMHLYLKTVNQEAQKALRALSETLIEKAEHHLTTVLPGYTHLQQAQPILLSHYLLAFFWAIQRFRQRLEENFVRLDVLPLGSGALAGSAFPIDRAFLASELGFARVSPNSLDAVSFRDTFTEFSGVLTQISVLLSRLSEDWILWSSQEFGFLTLPDAFSTGSSMMPQKKNPDSLELIRGKAASNAGHLQALLTLEKGLPLSYNRDLQEDKLHIFSVIDNVLPALKIVRKIVATSTFHPERMKEAVHPFTLATDAADYLVEKGLPFREAHAVVGKAVQKCVREKQNLTELTLEKWKTFSPLFEEDIFGWLTLAHSLERRNLPGGTGPKSVQTQLEQAKEQLRK